LKLKNWKIYVVLERQENYELSFPHSGSLYLEIFIRLLDFTRIPAHPFFVCFSCPIKRTFDGTPQPGKAGQEINHIKQSKKLIPEIKVQDT